MTAIEFHGALKILLILLYIGGFLFWLGFWLEDCQGRYIRRPFLLAVFWFVVIVPFMFNFGITAAQWFRRFNRRKK